MAARFVNKTKTLSFSQSDLTSLLFKLLMILKSILRRGASVLLFCFEALLIHITCDNP